MRPLDWRRVLGEERVPFVERGPNVKRGEINIKCPFCGSADPSHHMGLNLESGYWACWRNENHRGKSPLRLLMALLHIPYWKAREVAGLGETFIDPEGFDAVAARVLGRLKLEQGQSPFRKEFLRFPSDFAPLLGVSCRRHLAYLRSRGFDMLEDLVDLYDLQRGGGVWQDRVIIPYFIGQDLVAWTGRAIAYSSLRYRDLEVDECLVPIKETVYNYDCIAKGGKVLVLVEGPVDALKIDFYGRTVGVRAVALSTNSITDEQAFMLEEAEDQFERKLVMMDQSSMLANVVDSMRMKQRLGFIRGLETTGVPFDRKDAGALTAREAIRWTDHITGKGKL